MLITRETDYGVRIIRALRKQRQLTIQEICDRELIPKQFAYKILKKLEKSGLVAIRRGAGGGCALEKPLGEITLFDVISAVDEEFSVIHCLRKGDSCEYRKNAGVCQIHGEFYRVQKVLAEELKRFTLEELLKG